MAKVNLNRNTFVRVNTAGTKQLLQFNGAAVQLADTASPVADNWVTLGAGDMIVVETDKFARSAGTNTAYAVSVTV